MISGRSCRTRVHRPVKLRAALQASSLTLWDEATEKIVRFKDARMLKKPFESARYLRNRA